MKKINELGRSMVEMLGVLAIIGVISAGGLAGYSKAMYMYKMHNTISFVSDALVNYSLFVQRDIRDYPNDRTKMAENAHNFTLLPDCVPQGSALGDETYQVCKAPLGEIYPRFFTSTSSEGYYHTYMLYVTFLKNRQQACVDFLSKNWDRIVPEKVWRKGKMWLISNQGEAVMYGSGGGSLSITNLAGYCETLCGEGNSFCSVVFDFTGVKY